MLSDRHDGTDIPLDNIVIGTAIPDAQLPYSKERRIFDRGATMVQGQYKRSEDTLDYYIDLSKFLEPRETINSARAGSNTASMSVERVEFAPTGVVVWISGGKDLERNTVVAWVTTSLGKVKIFRFIIKTVGDAPPRVEIITTPISVVVGFSTSEMEPLPPDPTEPNELTLADDDGVPLADDDTTLLQDDNPT